mmetsp:Transcript_118740/g.347813  ORF Transcript_118740/g.347813 Transcript_118740/m.347813 type:complete len:686 (+) Transcript_118740:1080-3137(+)
MLRLCAAVAADVHVVAGLGGNEAQVLALGLRALAQAPGDGHLDLVRGAESLVAVLERHGHAHGVLLSIAAPGTSDTALHCAEGLAVGVPGLQARVHELLPDRRELVHWGPVHAQTLRTGDLGPQAELLSDRADGDEFIWGDVTAGATWDHRVGPGLLDVCQEAVVGVLDLVAPALEYVIVPKACKNGGKYGFADLAALALATGLEGFLEGLDLFHPHDVEELPAAVGKVGTDPRGNLLAQALQRCSQDLGHLPHRRAAASAASAHLGDLLQLRERCRVAVHHGLLDGALRNVEATAHHVIVRNACAITAVVHSPGGLTRGRLAERQALRSLASEIVLLAELEELVVVLRVSHKDPTQQSLTISREAELPVGAIDFVLALQGANIGVLPIKLALEPEALVPAKGGNVYTHELQLCAEVRLCVRGTVRAIRHVLHQGLGLIDAGSPKAVAECAADCRHLPNGIDGWVGGPQARVHFDTTTAPQLQAATLRELVARPDAARYHNEVDLDDLRLFCTSLQDLQPDCSPVLQQHLQDLDPCVHLNVQSLDLLSEHLAAGFVQLRGHQEGRHLQDVALELKVVHCLGRLQTQQPTPDDCGPLGTPGGGGNERIQVLDRPVHEDSLWSRGGVIRPLRALLLGQCHARRRGHEAITPRGEYEAVIRQAGDGACLVRVGDLLGCTVNAGAAAIH